MQIILIKSFTDKAWRSPQTYALIEASLRKKWQVKIIHPRNTAMLKKKLRKFKEKDEDLFVFNIAEFINEDKKEGFIPQILDEMKLPHLGSDLQASRAGLYKAMAKDLFLENDVPTPPFFVVNDEMQQVEKAAQKIGYPLIVKPLHEGGHIGIDGNSIVYDEPALEVAVNRVLHDYEQPALVEDYIVPKAMREFSVGVIEGEPPLFTPIEIDFDAMDTDEQILSFDLAQNDLEEICLVEEEGVRLRINQLAADAFDAVGARGYSRVDIRMNETGYFVLEINTMPGLGPHSFLPQAAKEIYGMNYEKLIQYLASYAMQRSLN
jgi:D-alanine-D-alanine ligase